MMNNHKLADQAKPRTEDAGPDSDEAPNAYVDSSRATVDFSDLEDDLGELEDPASMELDEIPPVFQTYPCRRCGGTGAWMGYYKTGKCRACNGTGRSSKPPLKMDEASVKRREQAKARKVRKAVDHNIASAEWKTTDELGIFLLSASSWSEFAADMLTVHHKHGEFTTAQELAIRSMMEKVKARDNRDPDADLSGGNLDAIFTIFTKAIENGQKRPVLRIAILEDADDEESDIAGHVKISLAPAGGRNAGHLYVKLNDDYQGKIDPEGKFFAIRDADPKIATELVGIAADPLAKAVLYGRKTGNCSCCGRELTNALSIELGIGPICRDKWGL